MRKKDTFVCDKKLMNVVRINPLSKAKILWRGDIASSAIAQSNARVLYEITDCYSG